MSMFGDSDKDGIFDEMEGFLYGTRYYNEQHSPSELIYILSTALGGYECKNERIIRDEIESEYKGYKEKYESMKEFMGEL